MHRTRCRCGLRVMRNMKGKEAMMPMGLVGSCPVQLLQTAAIVLSLWLSQKDNGEG